MSHHHLCIPAWRAALAAGVALVFVGAIPVSSRAADEPPFGLPQRVPWTASRVHGAPEATLPYTVERTFTNITWKSPIFLAAEPGASRLWIVQGGGEQNRPSRVFGLEEDPAVRQADTVLVVSNRLIYSLAFHPGFRTNGHVFVFSHGVAGDQARTNRISRYAVERQPALRCDPASERVILEWHSEGHDGGGLVFGLDGMLYISSGDGTSDSDAWVSGQDVSELLGGVLRIDVDHPGGSQTYSIPRDNPFVGWTNARPEIWAYGLRNPWRMCVDPKSGRLWVGNNGQDQWETAHLIRPGENYGWSVYEGSHPFYLNRRLGPTPPVPPTLEHSHAEFRSLTGGVVYHGTQLPDLEGVYVYGDYSSGEIWGALHDGSRLKSWRRLARTRLQITAFAVDPRGHLLVADHGGGLYRLVRAPRRQPTPRFPTRLSEAGLFVSTRELTPHPGVIPYSVNATGWADGASVERFMALPEDSRIGHLTNGAVLVQTLSLELEAGVPASRQRIETRLLTCQNGQWAGYAYRWNARQTDATLVGPAGDEQVLAIKDPDAPGGQRRQRWRFSSRAECMACHSRAAGFVLGLTELQLNRVHDYAGIRDHQLRALQHVGLFKGSVPKTSAPALVDPYDRSQDLEARARSYLHVNCAVCHVDAGGGNAKLELGFTTKPEKLNLLGARPQHDTFGVDNAMLVFPGDPDRSILYHRLSRRGRGQMPPLVSTTVDQAAVALFRDWIRDMKSGPALVREWTMPDLLPALERLRGGRSFEPGRQAFRTAGCSQCHRFAGEGGSVGPDLSGVGRRLVPRELLESVLLPSNVIADGYATTEIETKGGEWLTGRIEREDNRVVSLRPLAESGESAATVTVRKADIRQRRLSKLSNMPAGTVNGLEEAQILDLLAYLLSDGDSAHAAFQPIRP